MNILTTITRNQIRKARAQAVRSALVAITVRHPDYQAVGFDEAFINNQAAELIEPFLNEGVLPNTETLAALWAANSTNSAKGAQKAFANITPMISDFVYILATTEMPTHIFFSPSARNPSARIATNNTDTDYPADLQLGSSTY